ncbi:hypothetical protein HOG16_02725 [Candidatus Woesearchaeota archaeon]|jgi:intein/homing endonuclease|nr:hypothetical protein [Candidatus Woesearchaeota archaeon]MBT4322011.1 hypothetical protein [Candidatus Woesearchaeota archaeon]MBT4630757.1 hypothetical protein [Candidatus Woesearchaeota archaeon]
MNRRWDKKNGLVLPEDRSKELAELVGAIFGDGSMNNSVSKGFHLRLYGNLKKDKVYFEYLGELLKKLFGLRNVKISGHLADNTIRVRVCSRTLCEFLNNELEVPYSPKLDLKIPDWILNQNELFVCFIRGLFDTDGCVVFQKQDKYQYTLIKIACLKKLAVELKNKLEEIEIRSYICKKGPNPRNCDLVIRRSDSLNNWIEIIGSNNERNMTRLKIEKNEVARI